MKKHNRNFLFAVVSFEVILFLILIIIAYIGHISFKQTLIQQTKEQLHAIAKTSTKNMGASIANIQSELEVLALNPIIARHIKSEGDPSLIAEKWLFSIQSTLGRFGVSADAIYMLDAKGIVRLRIPHIQERIGEDYSQKPTVKRLLEEQKPCIGRVITYSGIEALAISLPIFEDGKFIGALRTLIHLQKLGSFLENIKWGKRGHAELICVNESLILYHPAKLEGESVHIEEKNFTKFDWTDIIYKISTEKEGTGVYAPITKVGDFVKNRELIMAFSSLKIGEELWSIVVTIPYDEIDGPIDRQGVNTVILMGTMILVFIVGTFTIFHVQKKRYLLEEKAKYFNRIANSAHQVRSLNEFNECIIATVPSAILVIGGNLEIILVNETYHTMFSKKDEIKFIDYYGDTRKIRSDSWLGQAVKQAKAREIVYKTEIEVENLGGKTFAIAIAHLNLSSSTYAKISSKIKSNIKTPPKYLMVIEDVTEHRQSRRALQLLASIVESSEMAIIGTTTDWKISSWNSGAEKIFGYSSREVLGESLNILLPPKNYQELTDIMSKLIGGERIVYYESARLTKEHDIITVSLSICPIRDPHGNVIGISTIAIDITERKKLEEEVRLREAELIHATRLASLGEMAAGVAHEINQPLTAIMNYSESVVDILEMHKIEAPYVGENLQKIIEQVRRAKNIIQHLRSFARREGNQHINVNTKEVIERVVQFLTPQLVLQEIHLEMDLDEDLHEVKGNKLQLEQVLTNIICNAMDALAEKSYREIKIVAKMRETNKIHITISDNGIGFDSKTAKKLFDPFFTSKEPGKGTGLGLSISYRIIKEHGGEIFAKSEENGAKFTIILPAII